jgi:hypothetical protein
MLKKIIALAFLIAIVVLVSDTNQSTIPFLANASKKEIQDPLENCEVYFDGCNNCKVGSSGLLGCTRMFCTDEMLREPKCVKFTDGSKNL